MRIERGMLRILIHSLVPSPPRTRMTSCITINARKKVCISVPYSWNSVGPGLIPTSINAPSMTAVTASPGTPSVISGIIAPPVVALLAHSEAASPSIEPFPYKSGRRATFLDSS